MRNLQSVLKGVRVDGIAVVLGGYVYPTVGQVFYRVIAAAVPELQFESPGTKSSGDKLVAHTDTHNRLLADELLNRVNYVVQHLRIAWSRRQQDAVRI